MAKHFPADYTLTQRKTVLDLRTAVAAIADNTTLSAAQTTSVKKLLLEVTSQLIDYVAITADQHESFLITDHIYRHNYFMKNDPAYRVRFLYTMDEGYQARSQNDAGVYELLRVYADVSDAHNVYDRNFIADALWLNARWAEYLAEPFNEISSLGEDAGFDRRVVGGASLTGRASWGANVAVDGVTYTTLETSIHFTGQFQMHIGESEVLYG